MAVVFVGFVSCSSAGAEDSVVFGLGFLSFGLEGAAALALCLCMAGESKASLGTSGLRAGGAVVPFSYFSTFKRLKCRGADRL